MQTNSHLGMKVCAQAVGQIEISDATELCHPFSTKVEFTVFPVDRTLPLSSSGGGLFGRPDP